MVEDPARTGSGQDLKLFVSLAVAGLEHHLKESEYVCKEFKYMKNLMFRVSLALALVAGFALAQTKTAQSAMVQVNLDNANYVIEGTITWKYDRDAAETYYDNVLVSGPVITVGTGAQPATPAAPAPDANKLQQHAQAERCTFFLGGTLASDTYTQTVNATRSWKFTWTYNITPKVTSVAAKTQWSSEETGGSVTIGTSGFVSSESYMVQANKKDKYSFTLTGSDGSSRVSDVVVKLQKLTAGGWADVASSELGTLAVSASGDYRYSGNAGTFGDATVVNKLHTGTGEQVSVILTSDSFTNNDADIAAGNVHQANFQASFPGIAEQGTYQLVVSGVIKGNSAAASQSFAVISNQVVIGGC
jgi:hypothetical protein